VTDITYIRTYEDWLYLAVVVDLFSRKVVAWSMHSQISKDILLNALLMAVWRRQPKKQVMVQSEQGSRYNVTNSLFNLLREFCSRALTYFIIPCLVYVFLLSNVAFRIFLLFFIISSVTYPRA